MGVSELTSVEAKLTDAVKGAVRTPILTPFVFEDVSGFGTVGIEVEVTVPTKELVTSKGFDGLDCFLDFHDWFVFHIDIIP